MTCNNIHAFNSAVILAGGRSQRMGFDKQLLAFDGKRIVQNNIDLLKSRFDDIMVATSRPELYDLGQVRVISDIYRDVGPLGGIHSALSNARSDAVFVIACDMPFVSVDYIDYMISRMVGRKFAACVTECRHRLEVFHAFYCKSALPFLEKRLVAGKFSIKSFVMKLDALVISEIDAEPYIDGRSIFTNINSPDEYDAFLGKSIP